MIFVFSGVFAIVALLLAAYRALAILPAQRWRRFQMR
jgi:hypothetical protein